MDTAIASIRALLGIQASTRPQDRAAAVIAARTAWNALPWTADTVYVFNVLGAMKPTDEAYILDNILWDLFVRVCKDDAKVIVNELLLLISEGDYMIPHAKIWIGQHCTKGNK